mmetsp:Transcript_10290/g.22636  ORF Transcript_10290/g.22636 Transcript_10290/m.22636 type:complete len:252 (+) Transcript_10290:1347-2102(+)
MPWSRGPRHLGCSIPEAGFVGVGSVRMNPTTSIAAPNRPGPRSNLRTASRGCRAQIDLELPGAKMLLVSSPALPSSPCYTDNDAPAASFQRPPGPSERGGVNKHCCFLRRRRRTVVGCAAVRFSSTAVRSLWSWLLLMMMILPRDLHPFPRFRTVGCAKMRQFALVLQIVPSNAVPTFLSKNKEPKEELLLVGVVVRIVAVAWMETVVVALAECFCLLRQHHHDSLVPHCSFRCGNRWMVTTAAWLFLLSP